VANREEYIPKDFLGYSFFTKAFTAEYQDTDAKSYKLFIIETPDRAALEKALNEYMKAANIKKDLIKDGIHEVDDQYQGRC
jgi:hypothetical protein